MQRLKAKPTAGRTGLCAARRRVVVCGAVGLVAIALTAVGTAPAETGRDAYNTGTQLLRAGKLREAETELQVAVSANDDRLQSPALYNLGHVRFRQGLEALKQGPNAEAAQARGQAAGDLADQAIQAADRALADEKVENLVRAYLLGRGARKELKAATQAVKKALATHGAVLSRWQRAEGDFKSASELAPARTDAAFNADVVDRHIAALVDQQQMMMQMAAGLGEKKKELDERMKKMKGKIPGGELPKAPGDDEEDDDGGKDQQQQQPEPQAGDREKETQEGKEMALTPEEAMRLLESLKLDANRKLPMGDQQTGQPQDRKRREW